MLEQKDYLPHLETNDWLKTSVSEPRGYIDAHALDELWFHTGTRCNLSCPFCLEGSNPTSDRLQYLSLEDVVPYLKEAEMLGVKRFSFTGGEPFLNKDMLAILKHALVKKPCLVLTNATKPLLNKFSEIKKLLDLENPLQFRISIDHPTEAKHDEGRGAGSYDMALKCMAELQEAGFKVSLARHADVKENKKEVDARYIEVLKAYGMQTEELNIVAFPDFLTPGAEVKVPEITNTCMTKYHNESSRKEFMCAFSRMVIKRDGQLQVTACTLVDDDPDYDLSSSLTTSLQTRVMLRHHRCFSCFSYGASCSEGT